MMNKSNYRWMWIVGGVICLLFIYSAYNPENSSLFPKCPFLMATGYQCAGCGSQRALHHLLHFDIQQAFYYNPLLVLLLPYVAILASLQFTSLKYRFPKLDFYFNHQYVSASLAIIVAAFWIGRNIWNF